MSMLDEIVVDVHMAEACETNNDGIWFQLDYLCGAHYSPPHLCDTLGLPYCVSFEDYTPTLS